MAHVNHGVSSIQAYMTPMGYAQDTTIDAASALPSIPDGAKLALIQVTAQNARWRDDGTDPTATVGMLLIANDLLIYTGDFSAFKIISATAGSILNVTYYK